MPNQSFRLGLAIQIRFKDVDQMGHVNNANHFSYFELSRMHYFREVIAEEIDWKRQGIILAHMEIDYRTPILLEDELWVFSRVSRIGRTSFEVEYELRIERSGTTLVAATGKSVQVCFDYERNEKVNVPDSWRAKALQFEGHIEGLNPS